MLSSFCQEKSEQPWSLRCIYVVTIRIKRVIKVKDILVPCNYSWVLPGNQENKQVEPDFNLVWKLCLVSIFSEKALCTSLQSQLGSYSSGRLCDWKIPPAYIYIYILSPLFFNVFDDTGGT